MMSETEIMECYRILTRDYTRMHASERSALDIAPQYREAMEAVHNGQVTRAIALVQPLRTAKGNAWRAKQNVTFINYEGLMED